MIMTSATQTDPRTRLEELLHEQESIQASIAGRTEALELAVISNDKVSLKTIHRELRQLEEREDEIALGISSLKPAAEEAARLAAEEKGRAADLEAVRLKDAFVAAVFEAESALRTMARDVWLPAWRKLTAAQQAAVAAHDRANDTNGRKGYDPFSAYSLPMDRAVDFGHFAMPLARYATWEEV